MTTDLPARATRPPLAERVLVDFPELRWAPHDQKAMGRWHGLELSVIGQRDSVCPTSDGERDAQNVGVIGNGILRRGDDQVELSG